MPTLDQPTPELLSPGLGWAFTNGENVVQDPFFLFIGSVKKG
jgi:hypothetical protein